jgi:hypothetical protein
MLICLAVAAAIGLVWWSLSWATSVRPLAVGAASFAPEGVRLVPHTQDSMDTGPAVYRWERGGRIVVVLYLHNSASVPVTITGVDHPGSYWEGWFSGPTTGIPAVHEDAIVKPFHPVRIPADGERGVSFVFRANPKACGHNAVDTENQQDLVNVHFTALGVFHDTQLVPLGDMAVYMTGPVGGC